MTCERHPQGTGLALERIAVGVSHNPQKAFVRSLLDAAGLHAVVVDTANKLQGREFEVCVCWHPLAGLDEADDFHVEAGRLCVMCTRHRHACIVVGRAGDRELIEGLPPATPAWPGAGFDYVLRGWEVHQNVFSALATRPRRVAGLEEWAKSGRLSPPRFGECGRPLWCITQLVVSSASSSDASSPTSTSGVSLSTANQDTLSSAASANDVPAAVWLSAGDTIIRSSSSKVTVLDRTGRPRRGG